MHFLLSDCQDNKQHLIVVSIWLALLHFPTIQTKKQVASLCYRIVSILNCKKPLLCCQTY